MTHPNNLTYILKNGRLDPDDHLVRVDLHRYEQAELVTLAYTYLAFSQTITSDGLPTALDEFQGTEAQWGAFIQAVEALDRRTAERRRLTRSERHA